MINCGYIFNCTLNGNEIKVYSPNKDKAVFDLLSSHGIKVNDVNDVRMYHKGNTFCEDGYSTHYECSIRTKEY